MRVPFSSFHHSCPPHFTEFPLILRQKRPTLHLVGRDLPMNIVMILWSRGREICQFETVSFKLDTSEGGSKWTEQWQGPYMQTRQRVPPTSQIYNFPKLARLGQICISEMFKRAWDLHQLVGVPRQFMLLHSCQQSIFAQKICPQLDTFFQLTNWKLYDSIGSVF